MDCARFEELLFAGLDTETGLVDLEQMAQHEQGCARCRRLAEVVAGNVEATPPEVADEIEATVFESTSGAAALAQLRRELPKLAEADPGPGFVNSVLAATSDRAAPHATPALASTPNPATAPKPAPAPSLPRREGPRPIDLSALWQRLARRPRLALEGSYVVTMLALLVFGLPSWSAAESPVQAFDSWWRELAEAAREVIESASESAQRGIDTLWNESESDSVEPDMND